MIHVLVIFPVNAFFEFVISSNKRSIKQIIIRQYTKLFIPFYISIPSEKKIFKVFVIILLPRIDAKIIIM